MMNSKITNKNNIIFFILLFFIPILALDASYYFLSSLNAEWDKKDLEKRAVQEAEILASEADFGNQLSMLFKKYCDVIKSDVQLSFGKDYFLTSHLEQTANTVFSKPFPEFNLHVFRIASESQTTEMLITLGNEKGGRRGLCLAFEHLYNLASNREVDPNKAKSNEAFAKNLVGQYTNVESIARESRGIPTYVNMHGKSNWFIWDYCTIPDKGVYGAILSCDDVNNFETVGRLLALKSQRARGRSIGAFIPVYKEFGDPIYQTPLENSKIFCDWAKTITIQKEDEYNKWMKEDFPQGVELGNYTAFTYLERGATHAAVILVKSLSEFTWPKWLKSLNLLLILSMVSIIFFGLCYGSWPPIKLKTRFVISYILASILPLCLLSVTAYGYIQQYRNTSINKGVSDLEAALKTFDAEKAASVNAYRSTFTKALEDSRLLSIIKDKGIDDILVAQRVVDIFEKDEHEKPLPILGVKICDVDGKGSFVKGSAPTSQNIDLLFKTCLSANIAVLRDKIKADDPDVVFNKTEFGAEDEGDIAAKAYLALTGGHIGSGMNKHTSVPIPRKNGDFYYNQIFDYIKIDGKVKYLLFVIWDDKTLDDRILQNAFDNYALKNLTQSFMGFRIKGQNVEYIGKKTRHATQKTIDKVTELAKLVGNNKRLSTYVDGDNLIVAMPSSNFSQCVLVGWISLSDVISGVLERRLYLILFLAVSLIILGICSLRSVGVFLFPATEITKALDAVSNGNLNISLESDSDDEMGQLSGEFSGMIDGLRERERLSKLISDQAVQALEKHSNALLNDTETFDGVALVSDIRNFTGISEANDPMVITDLLNEHFAEMTKIISDNGGLIYKFIGDAIEAVFPEKNDQKESASERAFRAGCMMIAVLVTINSRRVKRGLFTYRMGVGLCKGIMHSGSVGSLETRLDYAILGDALKTAAKFEALSIQNPSFPLIIGENIADKLAPLGFSFRKVDSKGEDFKAYTLENDDNNAKKESLEKSDKNEIASNDSSIVAEKNEMKVFTLQKNTADVVRKKTLLFNVAIFIIIICSLIIGFNAVYTAQFDTLKQESNLECSRLMTQLNCDDALKSSFEAVCIDFYEEINKVIFDIKDGQNLIDFIKPIEERFEKLGRPIPKYFCCKFKSDDILRVLDEDDMAYKGFSADFCRKIASIPVSIRLFKNSDSGVDNFVHPVLGGNTNAFNIRSSMYRRAAVATVEGEDVLVDTNRYYYDGENKNRDLIYGFVLCTMPLNTANTKERLNYYKVLAMRNYLLAFNNGSEWVFSDNFPEKESDFLKNNSQNYELLKNKGYTLGEIKLENEIWKVFAISRNTASYSRSMIVDDASIVLVALFIVLFTGYFFRKKIMLNGNSLVSKLRMDIVAAAILPLLTVSIVSYLYINEDYTVKKSEKRQELHKDMDLVESRECYFHPLCWNYIAKKINSEELLRLITQTDKANSPEEKAEAKKSVREYLIKYLCGNDRDIFHGIDPEFTIRETFLLSRKDWAVTVVNGENVNDKETKKNLGEDNADLVKKKEENIKSRVGDDGLTDFSRLFVDVFKTTYFGAGNKSNAKDALKGELVVEKLTSVLTSNFGNDAGARFLNFPNHPILMSVGYTTVGFFLAACPDMAHVNFMVLTMIFMSNEKLLRYCDIKNAAIDINRHMASGSVGSGTFIFTSPYVDIGRYLFYDAKENFAALREILNASCWIYSSKLPVSRTIDLNGDHYLEARPGNKIDDTVFLAFTSDKPVQNVVQQTASKIIFVIFLSVILIFFIAQSIISDLLSPIKMLMIGAKSAARGDYSFRINLNRKDELGALCSSFDKMMKGLEEKQLMNRMVSKTALNVSSGQIDASSKRIDAFLLYVSVPEFNKILKSTAPYELFSKLRYQITIIAEIVLNAGGDIDKIMGEKLLIAFPVHDKNPAEVAKAVCEAARAIETNEKLNYPVAVGANFGQVISGFLGVGEKRDFTVIGDPVNVAARIATLAEKQPSERRMISEPVLQLAANSVKAKEFGKVSLKGKSELLRVYQLI